MIVEATMENLVALEGLWRQYQDFYKVQDIDAGRNRKFIAHLLTHPQDAVIFVWLDQGQAVAFGTVYITYASTVAGRVAVLNDLYVQPEQRRKGIAAALIDAAKAAVKDRDVAVMRWMTQAGNTAAQALYRKYGQPSEWLLYSLKV